MSVSVSKSFTAVGQVSATIALLPGQAATLVITGTFVATLVLESTINNGVSWTTASTYTTTQASIPLPVQPSTASGTIVYRLRCTAYTSGTAVGALAISVGIVKDFINPGQNVVAEVTDEGMTVVGQTPMVPGTAVQRTTQMGVSVAATAAAAALGFGSTLATGLQFMEQEEVVSLAAAGAKFVALTNVIPSGAVIISAQMNIETLVVAGGTSVKVGLGSHGGTTNTWGNTGDLLKNTKSDLLPAYSVLGSDTTLDVCACASTASGLGDTNFSAGAVRVRIVYLKAVSLPDA